MQLSISFRPAIVKNIGGSEMISVQYDGSPNLCNSNFDASNVNECEQHLAIAVQRLKDTQPSGCYYVSIHENGRKVRGFDKWRKSNNYIDI